MTLTSELPGRVVALGGGRSADVRDRAVTAIAYDSRRATAGAIFVAVSGQRFDGAAFAADADRDRLLVAGQRTRRQDPWLKRVSSKIANAVRASLLGDGTPDTGCGLKVFSRVAFNAMPAFDHMHRFLPTLMLRLGGRVLSVPVNHRSRLEGVTKYGLFDRLGVGIVDLFGVWWLKRRAARPEIESDSGRGKNGDRDA